MIVIGAVLGYLIIGSFLGRQTFVRALGDEARYRYSRYSETTSWTTTMIRATWWSVALFLAWPVAALVVYMFQATPPEKLDRRRAELETMEEEINALARKYKLAIPREDQPPPPFVIAGF